MNTAMTSQEIIDQIEATRAAYGWPPLTEEQDKAAVEERRCDQIAELWVAHHGGPVAWKSSLRRIRSVFEFENRSGNIDVCDIVDTWEEDFELTLADFDRLQGEIYSWIVAHARAYGKSKF